LPANNIISIVEYIAADNSEAAEKLGPNLIELALSLNTTPYRGSPVKNRPGTLKADSRQLLDFTAGLIRQSALLKSSDFCTRARIQ
jgi:plasmid stabilization system protein ParE